MKLTLAVALHMAVLATAAPTALKLKRDDVQDADIASKVASESLKSAASMMSMFNNDNAEDMGTETDSGSNKPVPDYGTTMTPNSNVNFPGIDGQMPEGETATSKGAQKPTPTEDDEEEDEEEDSVSRPAASNPIIPSAPVASAAAASPSPTPSPSGDVYASGASSSYGSSDDLLGEEKETEESASEMKKGASASASPSASASTKPSAKPESTNPLGGLSIVDGLGGMLGGVL
ncbi:hypothetical protein BDV06DRAFT_20524 [Aspergillus oleicola]